jgi:hypothetical protein
MTNAENNRQYRELAQAIANQAQALADDGIEGSRYLQVRKICANVAMLLAWTDDDRPFGESAHRSFDEVTR